MTFGVNMKKITFVSVISFLVLGIQAQDISQIDSLFSELADENQFNGNVLILKGDQILYEKSLGFEDFEKGIQLDKNSVFELASIGKLYTAVCIGILKDQGKLEFDDPVKMHIQDFPFKKVKIRHLLNHTSGLPDYMDYFIENGEKGKRIYNEDVLQFLSLPEMQLSFSPRDSILYSNTGYVVLASLVEKVSGYAYDAFLEKYVWSPNGIHHSIGSMQKCREMTSIDHIAYGYRLDENNKCIPTNKEVDKNDVYAYGLRPIQGDGNIAATLENYAQFILALKNDKLLRKNTFDEFLQPGKLNAGTETDYGFGLFITEDKNEFYHTGSVPGYQSFFKHLIKQDVTVVYVRNVESWNWSWYAEFNELISKL